MGSYLDNFLAWLDLGSVGCGDFRGVWSRPKATPGRPRALQEAPSEAKRATRQPQEPPRGAERPLTAIFVRYWSDLGTPEP